MSRPPVGVRNNNPGNVRFANQSGAVRGELGFAKWATYDAGVRGADNQIMLYYTGRSINVDQPTQSIAGILEVYAPRNENNTANYINTVATRMGLDPNETIPVDRLTEFRNEIIRFEIGMSTEQGRQLAIAYNGDGTSTSNTPEETDQTIADQNTNNNQSVANESATVSQLDAERSRTSQRPDDGFTPSRNIQTSNNKFFPDWQPNVLSDYDNPSYYFRWFMMFETDESAAQNIDPLLNNISDKNKIIIAETGVTGLNIESVEIRTVTSPNNDTGLINAQEIKMRVYEPMGLTLYDKLVAAAFNLKIFNFQRCPYYLELKFHGYDEEGTFVDNIGPNGPDNKRWLWKLSLKDIQTEFTVSGTIYTVTMIQHNDIATMDNHFALDANFNVAGKTVKDIIDNVILQKEKSEELHYGYVRNKYKIDFQKLDTDAIKLSDIKVSELSIDLDPTNWTYVQTDKSISSTGSGTNENGTENVSFTRGTTIAQMVEQIFAGCIEGHKLTNRSSETKTAGADTEFIILPWIVADVKIRQGGLAYDVISNQYNREITYTIIPYVTTLTTSSAKQLAPIEKRDAGEMRRKAKIRAESAKFAKKYDYLFTGENTEVIKLDFQLDTLFKAIAPIYGGSSQYAGFSGAEYVESITLGALADNNAYLRSLYREREAVTQSISRGDIDPDQGRAELGQINQSISNAQRGAAGLNRLANQEIAKTVEGNVIQQVSNDLYLEDLLTVPSTAFKVTVDRSIRESGMDGSGSFESDPIEQSLTTAIVNQSKNNSMVNVELEIRGDPYWLGVTNLEESFFSSVLNTRSDLASYNSGSMYFMIKTVIPQGVDELSGAPILKNNEAFTGIYTVKIMTHKFDKGNFTQVISGVKDNNIDINIIGGF